MYALFLFCFILGFFVFFLVFRFNFVSFHFSWLKRNLEVKHVCQVLLKKKDNDNDNDAKQDLRFFKPSIMMGLTWVSLR